ncbi:uncharacterized protein LAESUDRAFT_757034 [Laetiporus sulphureus 93-53]|uniref:Uncharacterized protein n=1 Tax=Laetiporus sulphureus 93-53 TaxID=1314785 RepID=A0A165FEK0_9APHY|nr:uncharacterized protein LAESUDRAFT_757034 [Laetiporus sulphureus 93-53]KZT08851.1 hypothetical protein LAESUDRAFT_757034 [Laetiporus sulphureus 93-53]
MRFPPSRCPACPRSRLRRYRAPSASAQVKRPGRKPKSKMYVEESDETQDVDMDGEQGPRNALAESDTSGDHRCASGKIQVTHEEGEGEEDEEKERAHELRDNFLEAKDLRMDNFLNDAEKNIKIFLSSHFRDEGLIWSEQRVREKPILIGFFLEFLLRNRVFPESEQEKGLRRALQVIHLARKELPATFIIGKALPDSLGVGCENYLEADVTEDQEDKGEPEAKRCKVKEKEEDLAFEEAIGEVDTEVITPEVVESLGKAVQQEREAADADVGWGAGNASSEPHDPWAQPGSTWDEKTTNEPNLIMAFLGPTIFLLTPITAASTAPGKAARKNQSGTKMDVESGATPHDPFKDEITVLFEPAVAEKLIIGMGLAGTWVQLARQDLSAGSWTDEHAGGKQQRDEKGEFGVPTKLWYMEHLASIIPSYHTEP